MTTSVAVVFVIAVVATLLVVVIGLVVQLATPEAENAAAGALLVILLLAGIYAGFRFLRRRNRASAGTQILDQRFSQAADPETDLETLFHLTSYPIPEVADQAMLQL